MVLEGDVPPVPKNDFKRDPFVSSTRQKDLDDFFKAFADEHQIDPAKAKELFRFIPKEYIALTIAHAAVAYVDLIHQGKKPVIYLPDNFVEMGGARSFTLMFQVLNEVVQHLLKATVDQPHTVMVTSKRDFTELTSYLVTKSNSDGTVSLELKEYKGTLLDFSSPKEKQAVEKMMRNVRFQPALEDTDVLLLIDDAAYTGSDMSRNIFAAEYLSQGKDIPILLFVSAITKRMREYFTSRGATVFSNSEIPTIEDILDERYEIGTVEIAPTVTEYRLPDHLSLAKKFRGLMNGKMLYPLNDDPANKSRYPEVDELLRLTLSLFE